MGKKKTTSAAVAKPAKELSPADQHKEAGNKAFLAKDFEEAVKQYSSAIELTVDNPSHIYYANRANAYLALEEYQKCIDDCDDAIRVDGNFVKSYFRKARALSCLQKTS